MGSKSTIQHWPAPAGSEGRGAVNLETQSMEFDDSLAARDQSRETYGGTILSPQALPSRHRDGAPKAEGGSGWRLDLSPFGEGVLRRWRWWVVGGLVTGVAACLAGSFFLRIRYTAIATLLRQDPPTVTEGFRPRPMSAYTLAGLFRSPDLLERAGAQTHPPASVEELTESLRVTPERNGELVSVSISGSDLQFAIETANVVAREAERYTREMQAAEATAVHLQYRQQLDRLGRSLAELEAQLAAVAPSTVPIPQGVVAGASRPASGPPLLAAKLASAGAELVDLLTRYTEAHPLVQAQRAKIDVIEAQLAEAAARAPVPPSIHTPATSPDPPTGSSPAPPRTAETQALLGRVQEMEREHQMLSSRAALIRAFADQPPGYCQLLAPATPHTAIQHGRNLKLAALGCAGCLAGVGITLVLIFFIEIADDRLKTTADVRRVTGLPVLAVAGDLHGLSVRAREDQAFRIWTALQGRLSPSPNSGLVVGITSANPGEGRSTWINLLAGAASQLGFRVLTIATRPSTNGVAAASTRPPVAAEEDTAPSLALTTNALAAPEEVALRLTQPDSSPLVHIPLPGWVWNLERRKQWQAALNRWRRIDNLVILVELPPAAVPEAVLLAENLPNLVWLTASGAATATETRMRLETLRHARCNLVGAVVNRVSDVALPERFPRWIGRAEWAPRLQTEEA